jgi:membrane-bound inhibitor of C-type lysozyme
MKIKFNEVTKLSQIVAILLFVIIFAIGFFVGRKYENRFVLGEPFNKLTFMCADEKKIEATLFNNFIKIEIKNWGTAYLPETRAASGTRYANNDESLVFWNKAEGAFISEDNTDNITYKDCKIVRK